LAVAAERRGRENKNAGRHDRGGRGGARLDPKGVPVAGAEQARKPLDPTLLGTRGWARHRGAVAA
jgi:hypothetical protein